MSVVGLVQLSLTLTGVAKGLKLHTIAHPELVELVEKHFGADNLDSAKLKMAQVRRRKAT